MSFVSFRESESTFLLITATVKALAGAMTKNPPGGIVRSDAGSVDLNSTIVALSAVIFQPLRSTVNGPPLYNSIHSSVDLALVPIQATSLITTPKVGVAVGVAVKIVPVGVIVRVGVTVRVGVRVAVGVDEAVGLAVAVGVAVGEFKFLGVPQIGSWFISNPFLVTPSFVYQAESVSGNVTMRSIVPNVETFPAGHGPPLILAVSMILLDVSDSMRVSPLLARAPLKS